MEQFELLKSAVFENYNNGRFREALEMVEDSRPKYPEQANSILYWLACFYSLTGNSEKALTALKDAYDYGIWWCPKQLESDADLDKIRSDPRFEKIKLGMAEIFEKESIGATARCNIEERDKSQGYILNLHWKNDDIEHYSKYFAETFSQLDISAIYVQSSQIMSSKGYCWDNKALAIADVEESIGDYISKIEIMSGASQGAIIALMMAAKYGNNYIGIMPALKDTSFSQEIRNKEAKYRFLVGELDPFYNSCVENVNYLAGKGFDVKLISLGLIGHSFSADFTRIYVEVLKEVLH